MLVSPSEYVTSPKSTKCKVEIARMFLALRDPRSFQSQPEMVRDQKYPKVHNILKICSCFYSFYKFIYYFFKIIWAISR
jgi:hypothetical protein